MHRGGRQDHSRGWRIICIPWHLVRPIARTQKPHSQSAPSVIKEGWTTIKHHGGCATRYKSCLTVKRRRDKPYHPRYTLRWISLPKAACANSREATYFLLPATPIFISSTIISFTIWPLIKGNVPSYYCKRNILWYHDIPSSETAVYYITRGEISRSKNVELTSGRRKLHLQLSIPLLCSFQRLVLGAARELLSIRDRVKEQQYGEEVHAEIKVTKIAGTV